MPLVLRQYQRMDERLAAQGLAIRMVSARGPLTSASWLVGIGSLMEGMLNPGSQSGLDQPVDVQALVDNSLVAEFNDFDHDAVKAQAESYQP